MARGFADRLVLALRKKAPLVAGLDPRPEWLPPGFPRGRSARAGGVAAFHREVIDLLADLVVAVKPQVAFHEALGVPGMVAYADTLAHVRRRGLLAIADVKRGDVPSTAEAYAAAYLPAGAPWEADAITVNPLFGSDGMAPFLRTAREHGKGLFVLVRTSNPGAADVQDAPAGRIPFHLAMARRVATWGEDLVGRSGWSSVGAVVGATAPAQARAIRKVLPRAFFLLPGIGAQGGDPAALRGVAGAGGSGVLFSASRSINYAFRVGPWKDRFPPRRWAEAVRAAAEEAAASVAARR